MGRCEGEMEEDVDGLEAPPYVTHIVIRWTSAYQARSKPFIFLENIFSIRLDKAYVGNFPYSY